MKQIIFFLFMISAVKAVQNDRIFAFSHFTVMEEMSTVKEIVDVSKIYLDSDEEPINNVVFQLVDDYDQTFYFEKGKLFARPMLDRETIPEYNVEIFAYENGVQMAKARITIKVNDVNDHAPSFDTAQKHASVAENSPIDSKVTTFTATDLDDPETYGKLGYSLLTGSENFRIERKTGVIRTLKKFDREQKDTYELVVEAHDSDGIISMHRTSTATLTIHIDDVNDNPPVFSNNLIFKYIFENTEEEFDIEASDKDFGINAEMVYSLKPQNDYQLFTLRSENNKAFIKPIKGLDYEKYRNVPLQLHVIVKNTVPLVQEVAGSYQNEATIQIHVQNVNEAPEINPNMMFTIDENVPISTLVGKLKAIDPEGHNFHWKLIDPSGTFEVNTIGEIRVAKLIDREDKDEYKLTVEAGIDGVMSSSEIRILITDVNDNKPELDESSRHINMCDDIRKHQKIPSIISAIDLDTMSANGAITFIEKQGYDKDFAIQDLGNGSAVIHTQRDGFSAGTEVKLAFYLQDSGSPMMESEAEVTISVCSCNINGDCLEETLFAAADGKSFSIAAIIGLLILVMLIIVIISAVIVRRRQNEATIAYSVSKDEDDIRLTIGGVTEGCEEDTDNYCIRALTKNNKYSVMKEEPYIYHHYIPDVELPKQVLKNKLDGEATVPDTLKVYVEEGEGSVADSLSSLASDRTEDDQDYDYLKEWGPKFEKISKLYGN